MEYLASNYYTSLSNAQDRKSITEEWISPKPIGFSGSNDDLRLLVKNPIEDLIKVLFRSSYNIILSSTSEMITDVILDIDLTGVFVEQELYLGNGLERARYIYHIKEEVRK